MASAARGLRLSIRCSTLQHRTASRVRGQRLMTIMQAFTGSYLWSAYTTYIQSEDVDNILAPLLSLWTVSTGP